MAGIRLGALHTHAEQIIDIVKCRMHSLLQWLGPSATRHLASIVLVVASIQLGFRTVAMLNPNVLDDNEGDASIADVVLGSQIRVQR